MKALDFLIYRARYTAEIVGPAVLLLLSALFLITRIELLMQHRDRVKAYIRVADRPVDRFPADSVYHHSAAGLAGRGVR